MKYDPYNNYMSTDVVSTSLTEDWVCELVVPKHQALHTKANIDPFGLDLDWEEKEKEMIQLMHDKFGIGLAAPQIGYSYNMFVMNHEYLGDIGVYNPEILEVSDETCRFEEGCLSFPMLYLDITRPEKIKVNDFVLGDFNEDEKVQLDEISKKIIEYLNLLLEKKLDLFSSKINN